MSELPSNWEIAEGEDLFALVRGVTYSKSDASSIPAEGLVPILRANNIADGEIVTGDLVYVPASYVSPEQYLRPGDILIATSSGSRTVVGKAATANEQHKRYAFGAFCSVARPRIERLGEWLSVFSRTRAYRDYVEQVALGISINNLRGSDLKVMPIGVAPLPEQRRIVTKIDSLSAKSRPARDHLDHIPRLVEKYKQAILAAAFRGDLTREWRQSLGNETGSARLLSAVRKAHQIKWEESSRTPFVPHRPIAAEKQPFEIPALWSWTTAEEIVEPGCEIVYGIVQPGPKLASGIPYVRGTDIENGRIKIDQLLFTSTEIADKYSRASLKGGDILLGIIRATKVAIVPDELTGANITQGTARFRPSSAILTPFLARWLESSQAQDWLHSKYRGIDMPGLNLRDVRRLPVPLAPLDEQREIGVRIETAFAWIDRLYSEAASARKLTDHLDQAVLAKAFRGELVPQDPNDEPASVLLERIGAERRGACKVEGKRRAKAKT